MHAAGQPHTRQTRTHMLSIFAIVTGGAATAAEGDTPRGAVTAAATYTSVTLRIEGAICN